MGRDYRTECVMPYGAVPKFDFGTAPYRCVRMHKIQDTETDSTGHILPYVTEADDEVRAEQMSIATLPFAHYDIPLSI